MTREEINKLVEEIGKKVENKETLTDYEVLVYEEMMLAKKREQGSVNKNSRGLQILDGLNDKMR